MPVAGPCFGAMEAELRGLDLVWIWVTVWAETTHAEERLSRAPAGLRTCRASTSILRSCELALHSLSGTDLAVVARYHLPERRRPTSHEPRATHAPRIHVPGAKDTQCRANQQPTANEPGTWGSPCRASRPPGLSALGAGPAARRYARLQSQQQRAPTACSPAPIRLTFRSPISVGPAGTITSLQRSGAEMMTDQHT